MKSYLDLVSDVLENGEFVGNRTGIRTKMVVGRHFTHDMRSGFPLLTSKKINPQTIFVELEGFIKGITDKRWYQEHKCYIWDEWCNPQILTKYDLTDARSVIIQLIKENSVNPSLSPKMIIEINKLTELLEDLNTISSNDYSPAIIDIARKLAQLYETDLGPIYGYQWRNFGKQYRLEQIGESEYSYNAFNGIDQLKILVDRMKTNPLDRRMIVSAWNPIEIEANTMALPPCHWAFEVHSNGTEFDLIWHQRSVDVFLGLPYNIASYAMLMKLLEKETGLTARYLNGFLGNTHIYENHMEQVKLQLSREVYKLPTLKLPDDVNIFTWESNQWELINYQHHPFIKAPVAV